VPIMGLVNPFDYDYLWEETVWATSKECQTLLIT
jgi:hypothetical protein